MYEIRGWQRVDMLAILASGNYAIDIWETLKEQGYSLSVVPIPCKIAQSGCGHCLKFDKKIKDVVLRAINKKGFAIEALYEVLQTDQGITYKKIVL